MNGIVVAVVVAVASKDMQYAFNDLLNEKYGFALFVSVDLAGGYVQIYTIYGTIQNSKDILNTGNG